MLRLSQAGVQRSIQMAFLHVRLACQPLSDVPLPSGFTREMEKNMWIVKSQKPPRRDAFSAANMPELCCMFDINRPRSFPWKSFRIAWQERLALLAKGPHIGREGYIARRCYTHARPLIMFGKMVSKACLKEALIRCCGSSGPSDPSIEDHPSFEDNLDHGQRSSHRPNTRFTQMMTGFAMVAVDIMGRLAELT